MKLLGLNYFPYIAEMFISSLECWWGLGLKKKKKIFFCFWSSLLYNSHVRALPLWNQESGLEKEIQPQREWYSIALQLVQLFIQV